MSCLKSFQYQARSEFSCPICKQLQQLQVKYNILILPITDATLNMVTYSRP